MLTELNPLPSRQGDLGISGAALWAELTANYEFDAPELVIVIEASRVKDRLDALDAVVRAEGVTVLSPQGVKAHPALTESRQQQIVLTRLVASLRLPDEADERPQHRGASRGAYGARRSLGIVRSAGR